MKKITLSAARELINKYLQEKNNRLHSRESEVVVRVIAKHLNKDEELWAIAGLLHDLDWEQTADDFSQHGIRTLQILAEE